MDSRGCIQRSKGGADVAQCPDGLSAAVAAAVAAAAAAAVTVTVTVAEAAAVVATWVSMN
jgi:hypothetical protein